MENLAGLVVQPGQGFQAFGEGLFAGSSFITTSNTFTYRDTVAVDLNPEPAKGKELAWLDERIEEICVKL